MQCVCVTAGQRTQIVSQNSCFSAVSVPALLTPGNAASAEELGEHQWEVCPGY